MSTQTEFKPLYQGRKVTIAEYLDLEEDGFKYDMIEGVLYLAPPPNIDHGKTQFKFSGKLAAFLNKTDRGEAFTEGDILLPDGGDVLRPDVAFVLHDNPGKIDKYFHGTPDLICEILSDSTARRDLGVKADRYLANGVREYWIVDPRDRSLQLWLNRGGHWEKRRSATIASELLPEFVVSTSDLFPE